ncbi:MAG TPA: hypothetical protein VH583_22735 [Vicinamibacterales bacterium]
MSSLRYVLATLAIYTVLTAVMTYPQVLHLNDTVHDDGDPLLNAWAIAWVAHQLPIAPARLFDGNVFYPERHTLAFSETLLVPATIVAPLRWLGVGPLLVYNIVFLSGFIVSGAGVALLVRSLTGSGAAGVIGGIVFAFLPYRIDHYPHLQLQQTQCLPFAFWAFHRLLRTNRLKDGLLFGAFTAGQVLSCMYYGLFLVPYMAVVCGAMLVAERRMPRERLTALVAAVAIAIVAVVPVGRAYLGARKIVGERTAEEVANGSAMPRNYIGPPEANLLFGELLKPFADGERRLFPGFVAMALAVVALLPRKRTAGAGNASVLRADPRWSYALGLLLAFDLSLGFNGISYRVLYEYALPFRGLRIPARMGVMVGFSLAVLAGYGAQRIIERRHRIVWVIAALMLLEYASKPLDLRQIPTEPPESYADLVRDRGDSPTTAIFEFPASPFDDPTYMYFSTFHWQNLVNGYSGFFPPSYNRVLNAMRGFPDQASIDAIKAHGARYLLVHGERLFGGRYQQLIPQIEQRRDMILISRRPAVGPDGHKEISLYRISYTEAP